MVSIMIMLKIIPSNTLSLETLWYRGIMYRAATLFSNVFVLICYVSAVHLNVFLLCTGSYLLFCITIWRRIYHICFNLILSDDYQEQNILIISKENRLNPE